MKNMLRILFYLPCVGAMLLLNAHAYIDPATTSYLLQIVAGVFIAAGATVAVFWRKITFYFKKRKALRARKKKEREQ